MRRSSRPRPSEVFRGFSHQEAPQAHGEEEAPQAASQDSPPAPQQEVAASDTKRLSDGRALRVSPHPTRAGQRPQRGPHEVDHRPAAPRARRHAAHRRARGLRVRRAATCRVRSICRCRRSAIASTNCPTSAFDVICQVGGRSARVVEALEARGYDATNVEGGTGEWVARATPSSAEAGATARVRPMLIFGR